MKTPSTPDDEILVNQLQYLLDEIKAKRIKLPRYRFDNHATEEPELPSADEPDIPSADLPNAK
jgi:hypothetical protein